MLSLLCASLLTFTTAAADTQLTRVQRVFPFQVGQQYEFLAGRTYYRPNGEVLPPSTIARITVTDTVISGKMYLHIPYWSSFGTEYYRLDDSLKIWNYDPVSKQQRVLLNLRTLTRYRLNDGVGPGIECTLSGPLRNGYCNACCLDVMYTAIPGYPDEIIGIERPFDINYYADPERYLNSFNLAAHGWTMVGQDTVLAYSYNTCCPTVGLFELHGIGGPAIVYHQQVELCDGCWEPTPGPFRWGVFRPVSDGPWPRIAGILTAVSERRPLSAQPVLVSFPNPFNPVTTIRFTLAAASVVSLAVCDMAGRPVRVLVDEAPLVAGTHEVVWDGSDAFGRAAASGPYILRMATPDGVVTTKLTLVR